MPLTTCWDGVPEGASLDQLWLGLTGCTCCVHYGPCPEGHCDEFRCVTCSDDSDDDEATP